MGKPSRGDGYEFGECAFYRVRPPDMDLSLNHRRESGVWLGRRWRMAAHVVAVSPCEAREVRA
eukprot:13172550-Alexandrium_andersonii.AAC.1